MEKQTLPAVLGVAVVPATELEPFTHTINTIQYSTCIAHTVTEFLER